MNLSFLLTFINIKDINENMYGIRYFSFNNTKLSTNELNYIIWNNFSSIFNDKSFITLDDLTYTSGIDKASLINFFRLITSKNFIDYNNFSEFLNHVHCNDYLKLITNIPNDDLSTPSDWSSIGSDYDSDDSIINIENNITIQIQETINNPISPIPTMRPPPLIIPKNNKSFTLNLLSPSKQIDPYLSPTAKLSPKQIDKHLSPIAKISSSTSPKNSSLNSTISNQPKPVKFYDPNSIPKPKPQPKPKSRYHFCHFEYSSKKQHSWYIECFLYIQQWFKNQNYIRVPEWVKKYF